MSSLKKINDADFDSLVITPKKPVLVFFWATWNGASHVVRPCVEQAAGEYDQKLQFYDLDVDSNNVTTAKYGIKAVPTFILFKDGQVNNQISGVTSKQKLVEFIERK